MTTAADPTAYAVILGDPDAFPTVAEYRHALTWYALQGAPLPADLDTLRHLDAGLQVAVYALPAKLDAPHLIKLDDQLHDLRLRVAARIAARLALCAQVATWASAPAQDIPQDPDAPQAPPDAPQTDQERAALLLRAGLQLLMQSGQDGGQDDGGQRTRLTRPTPTRPPGGQANQPPGRPAPPAVIDF